MTDSVPFRRSNDGVFTLSRTFLALLLAASVIPLAGCGDLEAFENLRPDDERETELEEERVPVEVAALERGPIEAVLRFSTNLEAESSVKVYSQAARLVTDLLVEEGDTVRAGQVLIRLQDEEQRSALARTESQLTKAKREYQRQQNLYAKELISEQVMNDATYEVEQLELAAEDARRELSYTEVRAPIAGTITQRLVNLGDNIQIGAHLFDIVDFDSIVARIFVPEKDMTRLRLSQPARLQSEALDGSRQGEVIRVAPVVDPRSGTVKVTVGIPRNQGLLPGQYVEVELVVERLEDALLVPKRALLYEDTQVFMYRLADDMTVERLLVVPALEDADHVVPRPTEGGLAVGEQVVIAGQAGLKDGLAVRLAETDRGLPSLDDPAPSDESADEDTTEATS
ncbi:MAG: efflux RND transporter periplasmic adaptor subunit [Acidobacteriota bacterium]